MTKKSLVVKYTAIAKAGGSAIEVKNAITQTEEGLTPEDVDDIVLTVFDEVGEGEEKAPTNTAAISAVPGKKLYNILRGQWVAKRFVTGFDGKDTVIEWEFLPEGKAMKTGVPMEPDKAEIFNACKRIRAGRVFTEQMVEVGYTGKILDKLPNPFAVREIQS